MVYVRGIPTHIEKYKGKYITEGVKPDIIEGDCQLNTIAVIEFPTPENTRGFLDDKDVRPLFEIQHTSTTSNLS